MATAAFDELPEIILSRTIQEVPPVARCNAAWPVQCACGYRFQLEDEWHVFGRTLYTLPKGAGLATEDELPPGAMWDAWWLDHSFKGPDGRHLYVKLPGGVNWLIDGPCTRCKRPEDRTQEQHHCWYRAGDVPKITVEAGCGSAGVKTHAWSGTITAGRLVAA